MKDILFKHRILIHFYKLHCIKLFQVQSCVSSPLYKKPMVSETFVHQTHPKAESEALCRPASMATNDCNVSGNTEGMLVVPEIKFIKLFINSSLMPSLAIHLRHGTRADGRCAGPCRRGGQSRRGPGREGCQERGRIMSKFADLVE